MGDLDKGRFREAGKEGRGGAGGVSMKAKQRLRWGVL